MTLRGHRAKESRAERILALLAHYKPLPGVYDEILDKNGEPREHWKPVLNALADLGPREVERRFAGADRYLRDSGVYYRVYNDPQGVERPWPLAHMPLVIAPEEWATLTAGLTERAELLEQVIADLFGPAHLVSEGLLPAAAIAGSMDFLRPMVGATPRGGNHMLLYAVDVGRGPDGRWWVLGDRAQAPSGAGYALENRLAMARSLPEVYRTLPVERLAGFFQDVRAQFSSLAAGTDSRVAVLTPGPLNETYFEHAFLARYLGFVLAEGADLTVRDDTLYLRTVSGLKKLEMVWRRLDADFADPLELNPRSRLGVAGMVHALRSGQVTLANSLGSGIAEARSLLAFLPSIARARLGRDLAIPHVATWWCGQPLERGAVIADLDSFVIAPAYGQNVPGVISGATLVSDLAPEAKLRLAEEVRLRGADFVAQEVVKLSTMPVWRDGYLEPRPFILRLFLAKVGNKWTLMPGGFCRVGDRIDARAVTMQQDGRSADVCVLSTGPVEETTLLPAPDKIELRRATASLPSRAADNLFWLARYMERAEATLRLVRQLGDQVGSGDPMAGEATRRIIDLLVSWEALPKDRLMADPAAIAETVLHGKKFGSLASIAQSARGAASVIRDRFSPDAWLTITDLAALAETRPETDSATGAFDRVDQALRLAAAFSGLAQENMNQLIGWHFMKIGKRIERALATCRFTRQFADAKGGAGLDVLLGVCDSQITYRRRYVMIAARAPVLDMVLLDPNNPRSVAFQADRIRNHLDHLPDHRSDGRLNTVEKTVARILVELQTADAHTLDAKQIASLEQRFMTLSDDLSAQYFTHREGNQTFGIGEVPG
ncbi:hypothetical protein E8L99_00220 [Phreatobacter aquaticus]|uniref:Uncharacterized protein n=1 Tax=Phreatobacter aquaticus TaxID=2570229 RepID=A0A4D7QEV1_9HYPH|nr:circularly permuted type 2 ATP-grasp protein [Phreatobacter aquaticus]QCK84329.1 hypothetical protein E8L99_00220 [Phreatobacter aquaticus]